MPCLAPLPNPPLYRRLHRFLFGLLFAASLLLLTLPINTLQTLCFVLVRPFSRHHHWKICSNLVGFWENYFIFVSENILGITPVVSGDALVKSESTFLIANHQAMTDCNFIFFVARMMDRLKDMKFFVKNSVRYFPGIGPALLFVEMIFVRRNWYKDQVTIESAFSRLKKYDIPACIVIFPEGTRATAEKHAQSVEHARSRNVEPLRHLLMPRSKGSVATIASMRSHINAVIDVTIGFGEGGVPSLFQYMQGLGCRNTHVHIRRYPIQEIPVGEEDVKKWIFDRFKEKDELLEQFYKNGEFPAEPSPRPPLESTTSASPSGSMIFAPREKLSKVQPEP
jgi:1-acyl-sn-glycerol-3-phosphate acyltransferase